MPALAQTSISILFSRASKARESLPPLRMTGTISLTLQARDSLLLQVWFAHKPICGPCKADLRKLPDVSTAELEIAKMPAFQQALASPSGDYIYLLANSVEGRMHLPPGSFAQVRDRR